MAEVMSGRNLTTIVLDEDEAMYLRDVLADVQIRSLSGNDNDADRQIAALSQLWLALDEGLPTAKAVGDELIAAAGEDYHFREPDYGSEKEQ